MSKNMNKIMLVLVGLWMLIANVQSGQIPFAYSQFDQDPIWETYGSSQHTPAQFTWDISPSIGSARLGPIYYPQTTSVLWATIPKPPGNPIKYRFSFLYAGNWCPEDTLRITAGLLENVQIYHDPNVYRPYICMFSSEFPASTVPHTTITIGFTLHAFRSYVYDPAIGGSTWWIADVRLDPIYQ